jgi:transposase-like protein
MTKKKQSTESAESTVREIRRRTRRKFSPEEKIRIVLEGLRGEALAARCACCSRIDASQSTLTKSTASA